MWLVVYIEVRVGLKGKEEWVGVEDVVRVWVCKGWMVRILGSRIWGGYVVL